MTFVCLLAALSPGGMRLRPGGLWLWAAVKAHDGHLTDSTSENPEWVSLPSLLHDHHGYLLQPPEELQAWEHGRFVANEPWCPFVGEYSFKMKEPTWKITPKKCAFKITFSSLALLRKKWVGVK